MSLKPVALGLAACAALPAAARAGETACWFENGVVVVPAEVAGVAGDFILDTGAAHTVLAETQAEGAGFADPAFAGDHLETVHQRIRERRKREAPAASRAMRDPAARV